MPTPTVPGARARYLRTFLQVLIPVLLAVPTLLAQSGIRPHDVPVVGGVLAGIVVAATVLSRLMAMPSVEQVLRRYAPWLAATVTPPVPVWGPGTSGNVAKVTITRNVPPEPPMPPTGSTAVSMTPPPRMTPPTTPPQPPTPPAAA